MSDQSKQSPIAGSQEHSTSSQKESSDSQQHHLKLTENSTSIESSKHKSVGFSNNESLDSSSELNKTVLATSTNRSILFNDKTTHVEDEMNQTKSSSESSKSSFGQHHDEFATPSNTTNSTVANNKVFDRVQNTHHSGGIKNRKLTPYKIDSPRPNNQVENEESVFEEFQSTKENQSTPSRQSKNEHNDIQNRRDLLNNVTELIVPNNQSSSFHKNGRADDQNSDNSKELILEFLEILNDRFTELGQQTTFQIENINQRISDNSHASEQQITKLFNTIGLSNDSFKNAVGDIVVSNRRLLEDVFTRTKDNTALINLHGSQSQDTGTVRAQNLEIIRALQSQNKLQEQTHELLKNQTKGNSISGPFETITNLCIDMHNEMFNKNVQSNARRDNYVSCDYEFDFDQSLPENRGVQRTPLVNEPHIRPVQNTRRQYNDRNPAANSQVVDQENLNLEFTANLDLNNQNFSPQNPGFDLQTNHSTPGVHNRQPESAHVVQTSHQQSAKRDTQHNPLNSRSNCQNNGYNNYSPNNGQRQAFNNYQDCRKNTKGENFDRNNGNEHNHPNDGFNNPNRDYNHRPNNNGQHNRQNHIQNHNPRNNNPGDGFNDFHNRNPLDPNRREAEKTARRLCANPNQVPKHAEESHTKGYFLLDIIKQFCESNNLDSISLVKGWLNYAFPHLPASQFKNAHNKAAKNTRDDDLDTYFLKLARVIHGIKRPLSDVAKAKPATESVTSFAIRMLIEFQVVTKHDLDDILNTDDIVTDVYNHLCTLEIDDVGKHICMMKKQSFRNQRVTTEEQLLVITEDVDEIIRNNHTIKNPGNPSTVVIATGSQPDQSEPVIVSESKDSEASISFAETNKKLPKIECNNDKCNALFERKRPYDKFCYNCLPLPAPGILCNICDRPFHPEKDYYVSCRPCNKQYVQENQSKRNQKYKGQSKDRYNDRSNRNDRKPDRNSYRDSSRDDRKDSRRERYHENRDSSQKRGRDFSRKRDRFDSVNSSGSWRSDLNNSRDRNTERDDKSSKRESGSKDTRNNNAAHCGVVSSGPINGLETFLHTDNIGRHNLKEVIEPYKLDSNHSRLIAGFEESKFGIGTKGKALFDSGANLVTITESFIAQCEQDGNLSIHVNEDHKKVRDFEGKECNTLGTARFGIKIGEAYFEDDFTIIKGHHGCDIILGTPFLHKFGILTIMKNQIMSIMKSKNHQ